MRANSYKRKLILVFVGIHCLILRTTAQQTTWDSTYRPALYKTMANQFKSFASSNKDIVFLGNSISSYTNWSELLNEPHAKNRGIPGDITFGILERLDDIIRGKPAKIFILIGINDIGRNIPDSVIIKNYLRIVQRIRSGTPGSKIYFHTLLPVNSSFVPALPHFHKDEHIVAVNNGLKKLAEAEKFQVIDLYSAFVDADGQLKKEYSFDGLHPNDKGYQLWAAILKNGNYLH